MAGKTSKKSAKVAKKAAAKRVAAKAAKPRKAVAKSSARKPTKAATPTLLSGGNPQIAKADGDAPVQAYIAAMPGWKRDVGRRLDALIVRTVPNVHVRWNSPFYGIEGQGWFLGFHCFTKYVKVAFFRGTSLRPLPPASPRTRTRATSTSTRTTSSTRSSWRVGLGRHRSCPAGSRSAGLKLPANRSVLGLDDDGTPVDAWEVQVTENEVRRVYLDLAQALLTIRRDGHQIAGIGQSRGDRAR